MKRKTFNNLILVGSLCLFVMAGTAAAYVLMGGSSITRTRIQQAVHEWLSENLDDPNYEVVKWYDPIAYKNGGSTLVRLKMRVTGVFGAKVLDDMVFDVRGGKATESGFSNLPTDCVDDLFSGAVRPDDVDNVLRAPLDRPFVRSIFADAKAKGSPKS